MKGGGHGNKKRRRRRGGGGPRRSRSKSGTASPQKTPTQPFPNHGPGRKVQAHPADNERGPVYELIVGWARRRKRIAGVCGSWRILHRDRSGADQFFAAPPTSCKGARLLWIDLHPATRPAETETYVALRGEPCFSRSVETTAWKTRADSGRGGPVENSRQAGGWVGLKGPASGTGSAAVRPAGQRHWDVA